MTTAMLAAATDASAQRGFGRGYVDQNGFATPYGWGGNVKYDGRVTFARVMYRGGGRGAGWAHDFPRAESHFMRIIKEITAVRPFIEAGPVIGGNILALDDPELMKYPVAYLSEPGGWFPNDKEMLGLRNYLTKGGFLIVDDFDGGSMNQDWYHFVGVMRSVLPAARIVEMQQTHPIFDAFFKIDFNRLVSYGTGDKPGYFGIFQDNDPRKRVMVIVNFNQDMGDYWEWSDRGFNIAPTNEAYKLGVNYLIYALTH
ncbi:MAG: DUF4159 domain-containing protein [Gemmatimonadaceae bacterium]